MNQKLMEAMEYMDQKYIDEAVAPKARVVSYKPLMRWGAIAACLVLVVSLCIGYMGGLNPQIQGTEPQLNAPEKEIVLPPVRKNEVGLFASSYGFSIEEALELADAVAWVRVGNWLGEANDIINRSFFEVEVVQCFKGEISNEFVLCHLGSSAGTFTNLPLPTYGNEFLLFLDETPSWMNTDAYEITYYNIGMYDTWMDVVKDEAGNVYVSAVMSIFGESITALAQDAKNLVNDVQLKKELETKAKVIDEIQCERVENTDYLFQLDALKEYLK